MKENYIKYEVYSKTDQPHLAFQSRDLAESFYDQLAETQRICVKKNNFSGAAL